MPAAHIHTDLSLEVARNHYSYRLTLAWTISLKSPNIVSMARNGDLSNDTFQYEK